MGVVGVTGVEEVRADSKASKVVVKGKGAAAEPVKVWERLQKKSGRKVEIISPPLPPPPPLESKAPPSNREEEQKKEVHTHTHTHCYYSTTTYNGKDNHLPTTPTTTPLSTDRPLNY